MQITPITDIQINTCFWAAFFSWCLAQFIKLVIHFIKTKNIDFRYFVSTGGMPSAHSATVCGLATSIGIADGFASSMFALSAVFAIITMFDASTVRRAAGQQAAVLNEMVHELFHDHKLNNKRLKELLGHTRFEVFMGMLTGIIFSILFCFYIMPKK